MLIDLLFALALATACGGIHVTLLIALCWAPPTRGRPLQAWTASIAATIVLSIFIAIHLGYSGWLVTGLLIAATPVSFMVWSVLNWGATVTMWRVIRRTDVPLRLDIWQEVVSSGCSVPELVANRLLLLKRMHLIKESVPSRNWVRTPMGNAVDRLTAPFAATTQRHWAPHGNS